MTTREQIISAAKEADPGFDNGPNADGTISDSIVGIDAVERFYNIAFYRGYQTICTELLTRIKQLEAERDELKSIIALYDKALKASWPEGARGEAFDHWNAARKIIAKGEK